MTAVNVHGIAKVKRDTFVLANAFQNILDTPELIDADFERVRKYYDLLAMTAAELLSTLASHISERSYSFNLEETSALVAFLSPHRTIAPATLTYLRNLFAETYVIAATPGADSASASAADPTLAQ